MPGSGQQIPGQQPMNRSNMQMMQNSMIAAAMNALGFAGREAATLTAEEKVSVWKNNFLFMKFQL
jgi:hypothetical protein